MMQQSRLYFAYGANLNRDSMRWRCPRARPLRAVYLRDWQLAFSTHATIRPRTGAQVAGALWQITDQCEESLDRFEGYPTYYHKQYITIDGEEVMVYVMNSSGPQAPSAGYLATIAEGYDDWGLDQQWLWQAVKSTEEIIDDLHWSSTGHTGNTFDLDRVIPGLDPGHELRDLRDMEHSHSHR